MAVQFAAMGVGVVKDLLGAIAEAIQDPDTYKRLEGVRVFLSKLTGREIDENGLVALLKGATQGASYTGVWEWIDPNNHSKGGRLRVDDGYIYDIGRGNGIFVRDK